MQTFNEFKELIAPFLESWKSLEIRAIGDLQNNLLLSMVACLTREEPTHVDEVDKIQDIIFLRGSLPTTEVNTFIDGLSEDFINLASYKLGTQEFGLSQNIYVNQPNEDLALMWPDYTTFSNVVSINAWGNRNLEQIVKPRDTWAISRVLGFNGFQELAVNRLGFRVGGNRVLTLNIYAPLLVKLDVKLTESAASITAKFPTAFSPSKFFLSYRIEGERGNRLDGGKLLANSFVTEQSELGLGLSQLLPIPSGSARSEFLLFYEPHKGGNEPIAFCRSEVPVPTGRQNPRWTMLQSIVNNTREWTRGGTKAEEVLKRWAGLTSHRPDTEFELAVHCLLFLSGFSFLPVGGAEGVDVAVLENKPTANAFFISCTTSNKISQKVGDIQTQLNRLKNALPNYSIHGAIFAPLQPDDLTIRDVKKAQEQGIKLVLLPELKTIYDKTIGMEWEQASKVMIEILSMPNDWIAPTYNLFKQ